MHLNGPANPGDRLDRERIARRPNLLTSSPKSHVYFYVLKEEATPVGGWTEGAAVIPCYKPEPKPGEKSGPHSVCIHTPIPILAIHKSTAAGDASWLALEIPEKLRCTFADFALAEKRLLLQINRN
jgi:hypothetical protein